MSLLLKYTTPEDMLEYSEVADVEIRPKEEITLPELLEVFDKFVRTIGFVPPEGAVLEYSERVVNIGIDNMDNVDLWEWPEKGRNYD
jgi:hypothetical protein|tara:strand:+ start:1054 stop:1314 length:261 start_codon:yes stop_codon:yes gene_type:complete